MSAWKNYDAVIDTLLSHDFDVGALDIGVMVRPKRKGHDQKGWYILHEITLDDGSPVLIGSFGYWLGGEAFKEKIAPGKEYKLSKEQRDIIAKQHVENQKKQAEDTKKRNEEAAIKATERWNACNKEGDCTYLARKKVNAHGARYLNDEPDAMVLPIGDFTGKVYGLQILRGKNKQANALDKEFWPSGMAKKGHGHLLGNITLTSHVVLVAEGYATAATLHEATDLPVAVAYDAYNLLPVGENLRKKFKHISLLYCADDDYLSEGNPGVSAAQKAAAATGGAHIVPQFPADREGKKLTDFNDLANFTSCSNSTVLVQIQDKLTELGWGALSHKEGAGHAQSGGGDDEKRSMLYPDEVVTRFSPVWSPDDVFYFDHTAHVVVSKASITGRMRRHGWDMVQADAIWQEKPEVRIEEVDFDPACTDINVKYNLWHGLPPLPESSSASCDALLDLLWRLCSHEQTNATEIFEWVLNFLAYPLQNPGAKMQSCVLIHGSQGAGKNTFFGTLLDIYGHEYSVEFGPAQLENRFNAVFSKKLFAIGNEVVASREDLYHVKGNIKHMVTERRWVVEGKHKDQRWERNCCNFVFMSNEINPQVLDSGDRRHLVIWTPPVPDPNTQPDQFKNWQKLWSAAQNERANGGAFALYRILMDRDLSKFGESTWPPMTQAKQDLIDINMDSRERFYKLWRAGEIEGLPYMPCISEDLYAGYRKWTEKSGISRASPMHTFSAYLGKQADIKKSQERITGTTEMIKKVMMVPTELIPPSDSTRAKWLADCAADFSEKIKDYKGG